jgi:hypothetical protein
MFCPEKQRGIQSKRFPWDRPGISLGGERGCRRALVHAPSLEKQYVADGKPLNRRLVMYNDFVIIGPKIRQRSSFGENGSWWH